MLEESEFGAAFVDLSIEFRSGNELIRRLRARDADVPTLAIATGNDPTHRVRALDNGADDCIGRVFDVDERVARVGVWSRRLIGTAKRFVGAHHVSAWSWPLSGTAAAVSLMAASSKAAGRAPSEGNAPSSREGAFRGCRRWRLGVWAAEICRARVLD
jgi:DNA-binding response OmpR family regulator